MAARRNWSPDEVDRVVAFVLADATNREIGDLLDADHSTIVRLRRRPDVAARIDVARARGSALGRCAPDLDVSPPRR